MSSNPKSESYLRSLKCTSCGRQFSPDEVHTVCKCGKVLFAHYDLELAKESVTKESLVSRANNVWRIYELMPVRNPKYRYSLGEGGTPLISLHRIGKNMGLNSLYVKDEGQNPTGTFKSRGLGVAVSRAVELGIHDFVIPTAGNAGAALAAYCSYIGVRAHIYMPRDAPELVKKEIKLFNADLHLVDGLITDAAIVARDDAEKNNWFDVSTLKEPYRLEGKKTMGFELAEQFNWELPDVIVYPTGGGTGIIGMWKAFKELEEIGLVGSKKPKMISVQSSGCAPIVKAFNSNAIESSFWQNASTIAAGLRVPKALGDYLILDVIRESSGYAITVDDEEIIKSMKMLAQKGGVLLSPEGASTLAVLPKLLEKGIIDSDDKIVLFGTGSGFIMPELW